MCIQTRLSASLDMICCGELQSARRICLPVHYILTHSLYSLYSLYSGLRSDLIQSEFICYPTDACPQYKWHCALPPPATFDSLISGIESLACHTLLSSVLARIQCRPFASLPCDPAHRLRYKTCVLTELRRTPASCLAWSRLADIYAGNAATAAQEVRCPHSPLQACCIASSTHTLFTTASQHGLSLQLLLNMCLRYNTCNE